MMGTIWRTLFSYHHSFRYLRRLHCHPHSFIGSLIHLLLRSQSPHLINVLVPVKSSLGWIFWRTATTKCKSPIWFIWTRKYSRNHFPFNLLLISFYFGSKQTHVEWNGSARTFRFVRPNPKVVNYNWQNNYLSLAGISPASLALCVLNLLHSRLIRGEVNSSYRPIQRLG